MAPFPAELVNIGGDAQALNVYNDMEQVRQHIAGGLGIPSDLIYGAGAAWSGTSVSLRMLESMWLKSIKTIDKFVNSFVVKNVAAWLSLERIKINQRDFKMLDDSQQKQLALTLRQTNTISDRTVMQQLGFDYSEEQKQKRAEEDDRNNTMTRQMIAQATAQGQAQIVTARLQAQAELAQQQEMERGQRDKQLKEYDDVLDPAGKADMAQVADAVKSPKPALTGGSGITMSSSMLDTLADNAIKATPPDMMDDMVMRLQQQNPILAAAVRKRQGTLQKATVDMRPLPEQRAPRRNNGAI
jgi:hypothetical protein